MPKSMTLRIVISTVLMIVRPPGEPVTMNSLPSLATIVGDMLDSIRLPGRARLGSVPMRPCLVGQPRAGIEVAHLVVQQEPAARARRSSSRSRLRACRSSTTALRCASTIEKCVVSSRFRRPGEGRRRRLRRLRGVDRLAQLRGVVLREQPLDRHVLHEVGIAEDAARARQTRGASIRRCRWTFCAEPAPLALRS